MIKYYFILITSIFYQNSYSQLSEGNFLVGGSASLNSSKYNLPGGGSSNLSSAILSGDIGYFIGDKFVIGLNPGYSKSTVNSPYTNVEYFDIGPFLRYYILNIEKTVNIFSEFKYQFGFTKTNQNTESSNRNKFGSNAGVAVFFNSAVALEFSLGYEFLKYNNNSGSLNTVNSSIGFHFHLIK